MLCKSALPLPLPSIGTNFDALNDRNALPYHNLYSSSRGSVCIGPILSAATDRYGSVCKFRDVWIVHKFAWRMTSNPDFNGIEYLKTILDRHTVTTDLTQCDNNMWPIQLCHRLDIDWPSMSLQLFFFEKLEIRSVELGVCPMQLFNFLSRDVHPVQNLLLCTKFHENPMIFR